jgi:hypothetical protein
MTELGVMEDMQTPPPDAPANKQGMLSYSNQLPPKHQLPLIQVLHTASKTAGPAH